MKKKDNIKLITGEWIRKAQDDELSTKVIIKEKVAPSTACFLSQQLAEKILKAYLAENEKMIPKIHQLERLLGICKEINKDFKELDNEAVLLSEYYIESRYPGDIPEGFSSKDAKIAFETAIKIKKFVFEKLNI